MVPETVGLGRPRESLAWEQVSVGDPLHGFTLPITMKTIVLGSTGTRDYMPYHHNDEFCRRSGIRGAFVNTTFNQALVGRCVTDWSGPDADIRSVTLQMTDQLCLGDVARVDGTVVRTWAEGDDRLVEVRVRIRNERGTTAEAPVVVAMSGEHGLVRTRVLDDTPPQVTVDPDMPAELRGRLQDTVTRESVVPVSEAGILSWCEMVRDGNPLYVDTGYSRDGRFGGVVAPAMAMSVWVLTLGSQTGIDSLHPDVDLPEQDAWPAPVSGDWPFEWRAPGTTEVIVQRRHAEFGVPVRPGDRISSTSRLLDCSGMKQTKVGPGHFLSRWEQYRNQRDEVVGYTVMTLLQYGVRADAMTARP